MKIPKAATPTCDMESMAVRRRLQTECCTWCGSRDLILYHQLTGELFMPVGCQSCVGACAPYILQSGLVTCTLELGPLELLGLAFNTDESDTDSSPSVSRVRLQ
jgi:hypothetical protein